MQKTAAILLSVTAITANDIIAPAQIAGDNTIVDMKNQWDAKEMKGKAMDFMNKFEGDIKQVPEWNNQYRGQINNMLKNADDAKLQTIFDEAVTGKLNLEIEAKKEFKAAQFKPDFDMYDDNFIMRKKNDKKVQKKADDIVAPVVVATPVVAKPVVATPVVVATPIVATPIVAKPVVATPVVATPVIATPVVATPVVATTTTATVAVVADKKDNKMHKKHYMMNKDADFDFDMFEGKYDHKYNNKYDNKMDMKMDDKMDNVEKKKINLNVDADIIKVDRHMKHRKPQHWGRMHSYSNSDSCDDNKVIIKKDIKKVGSSMD